VVDEEFVRQVVELAVQAPSVYNTQPWRFLATGTHIDLYADRTRQLRRLDPAGRQLTISCGAALGLARLAVAALGRSCSVRLLPTEDGDHLARLTIDGARPTSPDDLHLVRQIGRRRTARDRFGTEPLTRAERGALAREAALEGVSLQWIDGTAGRVAVAVLTDRAGRLEAADGAIRAELARWWRADGAADDGITPGGLSSVPPGLRASDVPLREFAARGDPGTADPQQLPLPAEHPDLALVRTDGDGPIDWLRSGQALGRLLLRGTGLGVSASPVGQALDLPWTRHRLERELGPGGHAQLVLRLGHAPAGGTTSPRRPVDDVLKVRP
jgi:hypothetical protein